MQNFHRTVRITNFSHMVIQFQFSGTKFKVKMLKYILTLKFVSWFCSIKRKKRHKHIHIRFYFCYYIKTNNYQFWIKKKYFFIQAELNAEIVHPRCKNIFICLIRTKQRRIKPIDTEVTETSVWFLQGFLWLLSDSFRLGNFCRIYCNILLSAELKKAFILHFAQSNDLGCINAWKLIGNRK